MKLIPHASGSDGNLYELVSGKRRLLIECGLPWKHLQEALGHKVSGLDGCLLTHGHGDHGCSAGPVMAAGVDLYATLETLQMLDVATIDHQAHYRAHVLEPMRAVGVGPWQVLPFPVVHDAEGSLGFLIGAPDGDQVLFATDTAYVPVEAHGCTHIALECSWSAELLEASDLEPHRKERMVRNHMSLELVIQKLRQADLSRVKEIHLLHISGAFGHPGEFAAAVRAATGKPVYAKGAK